MTDAPTTAHWLRREPDGSTGFLPAGVDALESQEAQDSTASSSTACRQESTQAVAPEKHRRPRRRRQRQGHGKQVAQNSKLRASQSQPDPLERQHTMHPSSSLSLGASGPLDAHGASQPVEPTTQERVKKWNGFASFAAKLGSRVVVPQGRNQCGKTLRSKTSSTGSLSNYASTLQIRALNIDIKPKQ